LVWRFSFRGIKGVNQSRQQKRLCVGSLADGKTGEHCRRKERNSDSHVETLHKDWKHLISLVTSLSSPTSVGKAKVEIRRDVDQRDPPSLQYRIDLAWPSPHGGRETGFVDSTCKRDARWLKE